MTYIDSHTERQIVRDLAGFTITELAALGHTAVADTSEDLAEHRCVYLDFPDTGARIMVSLVMGNPDRVQVMGAYPQNRAYKVERFSATVARDRGPRAVAKAIVSKILDAGYTEQLAKIHDSLRVDREAAVARQVLGKALAARLPHTDFTDTTPTETRTPLRFYDRTSHDFAVYGDARINFDATRVEIEIRGLSPAQALAIADVIAGRRKAD